MRKAVVTAGVSYHHALTSPGELLGGFDTLDVHALMQVDLADYDIVLVLRSVDGEALRARRHQFSRFLDGGGVLIVFGEAWTNWFSGCRWEPECAEDLLPPVLADHWLLDGVTGDEMNWHAKEPHWCNHGHLVPPAGVEVLIANQRGDAWLYVDRVTTTGVILAATNVDLDTHSFHGGGLARKLFQRMITWAEQEASGVGARRENVAPKIAGLFSGVHFQRGFYADREFGHHFAIVPMEELAGLDLSRYPAVWVPRESNQAILVRHRDRLAAYLAGGGTIVALEEMNQPWLPAIDWQQRRIDTASLMPTGHPLMAELEPEQVRWYAHGTLSPPVHASSLVNEGSGGSVLYIDELTYAPGRVMIGTLDPDCHIGYGSDMPRPLLRAMLHWLFNGEHSEPIVVAGHGSLGRRAD
ncbi:MAG: hypothetical protein ACRDJW_21555 [Thermomicrobiales bacterium]